MHPTGNSLLVVDDNEMNRDMLCRRLARHGYTVACASDGRTALEMIETQQFDLILLDIMMPGMSGLEVLQTIRERYSVADLPIIMATARDQSNDIVEALNLGANDYVTKPLDFPVVLARVQTQLSLKHAMQEIQHLAEQLEQRNRFIRATFGRYLSDEVVSNLLDSPDGLQLGGEKRTITILVSDLRGFTALSERLTPEQVVTIVNRYLETMTEIIMQYQGTIQELMGDGLLVFFGAPIRRDNDAQRAVACAVAMQLAMDSVNAQNSAEGLPAVEMGIGIHTGEVVVGNIGSFKRTKYGAVGSNVNLPFRIESYTVGDQILISEATRQEVGSCVQIGRQIEVETKGVEEPLTLYDVQGISGEYNLWLPAWEDTFLSLQETIPVHYTLLAGKHLSETLFPGRLVKLSAKGGLVHSEQLVPALTDIKMQLTSSNGRKIPGDLYAKVLRKSTEHTTSFYVHFTSIPPTVATFLQECLASCSPGNRI